MKLFSASLTLCLIASPFAFAVEKIPSKFTDLNQYVVTAPNQGDAETCLFMASTGAMEILLSKNLNLRKPKMWGASDLSERYLLTMQRTAIQNPKSWFENAFLIFNATHEAILAKDIPFEAYDEYGDENTSVWNTPENFDTAPRVKLPKVDTVYLFSVGNKYSKNVLDESHVLQVKEALARYKSPVITVGNDEAYWHVTVIVGYDDDATDGACYGLDSKVCKDKKGVFFVRDSFGNGLEKRSYEWFIRRQNSAAVAKLAE